MWPVFPMSQTVFVLAIISALIFLSIRFVQPAWWRSRHVRVGLSIVLAMFALGFALWAIGESTGRFDAVRFGAGLVYVGVFSLLPAAIVMPFAAGADRALMYFTSPSPSSSPKPKPKTASMIRQTLSKTRVKVSRRALIRFGAGSIPTMAAATASAGFMKNNGAPTMPILRLRYPNLHPDLEGLRILQLSDLHLGAGFLDLDDLKRGLEIAFAVRRPDLIVITGDVCDDPAKIPEALRLVEEANPKYGALACLGNHEYLHDIALTRPKFEASNIPLLVGTGRTLRIGRATLFVGGADDPVQMHGDIAGALTPSIESAAAMMPRDADFRLLLCHRPEGFLPANANAFDLTLSGHTHGGQIGFLGRSILEKIKPGIGWWGAYAKERSRTSREQTSGPGGPSRLYTTSGFGHWFPFRLGCPTEMPLIVLEGSPSHEMAHEIGGFRDAPRDA